MIVKNGLNINTDYFENHEMLVKHYKRAVNQKLLETPCTPNYQIRKNQ